VEYRRVGNSGGGWPGTFSDIRAAYQFVVQNTARYEIDAKRVIVLGHSAGGQLALCLAAHEPGLKAAISLAGVVDLQRAYELHLSNDAVVEFLGGTPKEVPDHYREADPMKLTITARQWLVHGAEDDIVPPELSREYVKAKIKENAKLVMIEKAGHFEIVDPRARAWADVEKIVLEAAG
jgi:dipeptidyl aminopeptidase/acylaminoacyl peptidase